MQIGGGSNIAEITYKKFRLVQACGFFRLQLEFSTQVREQSASRRIQVTDLCGELQIPMDRRETVPVARLTAYNEPLLINAQDSSYSTHIILEADLDRAQVDQLEQARGAADLMMCVQLRALVHEDGNVRQTVVQDSISINRGNWIDALAKVGYHDLLVIALPVTRGGKRGVRKATEHIRAAALASQNGEYRDAVSKCRDALEALQPILGDDKNVDFAGSHAFCKEKRVLLLMKALKKLPHAAKHEQTHDLPIEWTRHDADLMVTTTAALVRMAAAL